MTVIKAAIPKESILTSGKYDYGDSFQGVLNDPENKVVIDDIARSFFLGGPKWIGKLFAFRNRIVSVFGLKTSGNMADRKNQPDDFKFEIGNRFGLFEVLDRTSNEIVLGEDDTHLNFRVSLFLSEPKKERSQRAVTISTTVQFNNWFGRLYFLPVRPFHQLIVPTMLKGIIREVEKRNPSKKGTTR